MSCLRFLPLLSLHDILVKLLKLSMATKDVDHCSRSNLHNYIVFAIFSLLFFVHVFVHSYQIALFIHSLSKLDKFLEKILETNSTVIVSVCYSLDINVIKARCSLLKISQSLVLTIIFKALRGIIQIILPFWWHVL